MESEHHVEDDLFSFGVTYPSPTELITFVFGNRSRLDHIANLVQAGGLASYEAPTPGVLVSLCRDQPGLVLDIGANTGLLSLLAAASSPAVQVVAFEPLAPVRRRLEDNLRLNPGLAQRITVEPFGLSRSAGEFPFYETINDHGLVTTSSSLELGHAQHAGQYREHRIATRTLDGWAATLDDAPIRVIKCDVEGHEHAVLEGGWQTLARHRPFIVIEVLSVAETDIHNRLLRELDYLDFTLTPGALRGCTSVRFHPDAWNHLLVPAERAGRVFSLCRQLGLALGLR